MNKWTTQSLAAAIKKFTEDHVKDMEEPRNYEDEARWFTAFQLAEEMREAYTTKDWAHLIKDGLQPMTEEAVDEQFNPVILTDDGDKVEPLDRKDMMVMIRSFYGIKLDE